MPEPRTVGDYRRLLTCVEKWPDAEEGKYDPRCCRFPKSCSCTIYESGTPDADLEPRPVDNDLWALPSVEAALLEAAWGLIANANEGNWGKATSDWRNAAIRWRDQYHNWLAEHIDGAAQ